MPPGRFSVPPPDSINSDVQNKGSLVPTVVLASTSPTRQRLLESIRIPFEALPARIDEEAVRLALLADGASARDIADTLGELKAQKVVAKRPDAIVIGSDQVLSIKGNVLGKPKDRTEAARQLMQLQGQQHLLLSSAVVFSDGKPVWRSIGQARLRMHAMDEAEIEAYLDTAWPDVAGSVGAYHAEGYGARLFSRIEGDWYSVLGLPLLDLCSYFRLRGWLT
jgi:septum formation protein